MNDRDARPARMTPEDRRILKSLRERLERWNRSLERSWREVPRWRASALRSHEFLQAVRDLYRQFGLEADRYATWPVRSAKVSMPPARRARIKFSQKKYSVKKRLERIERQLNEWKAGERQHPPVFDGKPTPLITLLYRGFGLDARCYCRPSRPGLPDPFEADVREFYAHTHNDGTGGHRHE